MLQQSFLDDEKEYTIKIELGQCSACIFWYIAYSKHGMGAQFVQDIDICERKVDFLWEWKTKTLEK